MFNEYFDRMSHVHRLLNVNQFIKQSTQPGGGGTISTESGAPLTSGVVLGGAKGIPTAVKQDRTLSPLEVRAAMDSLKEKGVKYLGSWNPDPNDKEIPQEKQGINLDAVSQHTRESVQEEFPKRPKEFSAYDLNKGEEIKNPYFKGE